MQVKYPDLIDITNRSIIELRKLYNISEVDEFTNHLLTDEGLLLAATLAVPFYEEQIFTQISSIWENTHINKPRGVKNMWFWQDAKDSIDKMEKNANFAKGDAKGWMVMTGFVDHQISQILMPKYKDGAVLAEPKAQFDIDIRVQYLAQELARNICVKAFQFSGINFQDANDFYMSYSGREFISPSSEFYTFVKDICVNNQIKALYRGFRIVKHYDRIVTMIPGSNFEELVYTCGNDHKDLLSKEWASYCYHEYSEKICENQIYRISPSNKPSALNDYELAIVKVGSQLSLLALNTSSYFEYVERVLIKEGEYSELEKLKAKNLSEKQKIMDDLL